jgi:hypothetical protein
MNNTQPPRYKGRRVVVFAYTDTRPHNCGVVIEETENFALVKPDRWRREEWHPKTTIEEIL